MPLGDVTTIDVLWIVLSAFLVVVGLALAILLIRLAGAAGRLAALVAGLEKTIVPLLTRAESSVEKINLQLDKVDLVTDSAVSAADSVDTALRAVSMAITRPVQKLSAIAKGLQHGGAALMAERDVKSAMEAGKDAARRRESELAEELARRDRLAALHASRRASAGEAGSSSSADAHEESASD